MGGLGKQPFSVKTGLAKRAARRYSLRSFE